MLFNTNGLSGAEPWNYVELIIGLVVDFAAMGYKMSLRLHDYVDANVKDIFKSNLVRP